MARVRVSCTKTAVDSSMLLFGNVTLSFHSFDIADKSLTQSGVSMQLHLHSHQCRMLPVRAQFKIPASLACPCLIMPLRPAAASPSPRLHKGKRTTTQMFAAAAQKSFARCLTRAMSSTPGFTHLFAGAKHAEAYALYRYGTVRTDSLGNRLFRGISPA